MITTAKNIDSYLAHITSPDNKAEYYSKIENIIKPVVTRVNLIYNFTTPFAFAGIGWMLLALAAIWLKPGPTNGYLLIFLISFTISIFFHSLPRVIINRFRKESKLLWKLSKIEEHNLIPLWEVTSQFANNITVYDSYGDSVDRNVFKDPLSILYFSDNEHIRKLAAITHPRRRRFTKKLRIKKEPIETSPSTVNVNTVNNDMSVKTINLNYSDSNLEGDETILTENKKRNYPVNKNNWLAAPTNKKFNDGIKEYEKVIPVNGKEAIEINILIGARKALIKYEGKNITQKQLIKFIHEHLRSVGLITKDSTKGASTSLIAKRVNGKNGNINIKDYIKP